VHTRETPDYEWVDDFARVLGDELGETAQRCFFAFFPSVVFRKKSSFGECFFDFGEQIILFQQALINKFRVYPQVQVDTHPVFQPRTRLL
jgi:hypothetical protein